MRVLILGGTGVMGRPTVDILNNMHPTCDIYVTSRSKRNDNNNVKYIQGDAHDLPFLKSILNTKYDCIIDYMHYEYPAFLQNAPFLLDATDHYIFLSSCRVYANSETIYENSVKLYDTSNDKEYLLSNDYAIVKTREEIYLYNSGYNNWTIIRPYITFNSDRIQLGIYEKEDWLFRLINKQTLYVGKDVLSKYTSITYGEDVARFLVSIIGKKNVLTNSINVVTSERYKWSDILSVYIEYIEMNFNYTPDIKLMESSKDLLCVLEAQKYQIKYDRLYDRKFDNSKVFEIEKDFVFNDTKECLFHVLDVFFESGGNFKKINPNLMAYFDRFSHEYTKLSCFRSRGEKMKYIIARFFPFSLLIYLKLYFRLANFKRFLFHRH